MTEAVVLFYLMKQKQARRFPWQQAQFLLEEGEWNDRRVITVGIPEYDYRKQFWKENTLSRKLCGQLTESLALKHPENTVFFCRPSLAGNYVRIGMRDGAQVCRKVLQEVFPLELMAGEQGLGPVRDTPADVLEELVRGECTYDALVLLDGAASVKAGDGGVGHSWGVSGPVLAENYSHRVNYLTVVQAHQEQYEEAFEQLEEEYGLNGIFTDRPARLRVPEKYQTLVIDRTDFFDSALWRYLPKNCTYLDLLSSGRRQHMMEIRRKDVRYLSFRSEIEKSLHLQGINVVE
mgnify:CR=1 FL=1